jgi:predicted dithiol-disulfide oxidoreductase (DUF899 family)
MGTMLRPVVGTREEWRSGRLALLAKEKRLSRLRDELSRERRELPWVCVDEEYVFDTPDGPRSLSELFGSKSQLLVYHFMFGPDWTEGCPSCSFWIDGFDGMAVHLAHRDVELVAVSRAPRERLEAYKARMGWRIPWVSSLGNRFNFDFGVSFGEEARGQGSEYNYGPIARPHEEMPGMSVFAKDPDGAVFHTYSCYSRGLDVFNSAYQLLDVVPKGRDEQDLPWSMAWLRRHDAYDE